MSWNNVCRICSAWLLQHPKLKGWLKCHSCGYSKVEKQVITLEMYLMGRDKQYASDYSVEIENNAKELLEKVNALLKDLGIDKVQVNSGWRPPAVNAGVAAAAKKSNHMIGKAVDLGDADCSLWNILMKNMDLLKKYGLYLEDKRWTKTWVHIQSIAPKSGNRVFIPSSAPPIAPDLWDGKYDPKYNG